MKDKIDRYNHLSHEITKLYLERNELESDIVDEFLTDKEKYSNLETDWYFINFAFKSKRIIDYEKMERDYPEIYMLGLRPTFSKDTLLNSLDKNITENIIKECTYLENKYKITRKKKYKKKGVDEDE